MRNKGKMRNKTLVAAFLLSALMWTCVGCGGGTQSVDVDQEKNVQKVSEKSTDNDVQKVSEESTDNDVQKVSEESTDNDISHVIQDTSVTADKMSGVELSEYSESRTITVRIHDVYGNEGSGTGFFIDDQGTFITNYHVIEYADSFEIQLGNAVYDVKKIINFSEKYDLAILKADIEGNDYFTLSNDVKKGEQVYAIGSALGELDDTITSGIISNTSREIGLINCIQMDAAISPGNSGGPLLNEQGQVVGINSYSFTSGADLNLAIKTEMLDSLGAERNYSIVDYIEWWKTEISRSYRPTDMENTNLCKYSLINTYQNYTGEDCLMSLDSLYLSEVEDYAEDYNEDYWVFLYDYSQENYDKYVSYLKELGFVYDPDESGDYDLGACSTFYSSSAGFVIDLIVTNEKSEYGAKALLIRVGY